MLKAFYSLNVFSIDLILFQVTHFNITWGVSWLPNQFKKHWQSKQQPLRGETFNIFGKGGEPYMGGLSILWEDLITP